MLYNPRLTHKKSRLFQAFNFNMQKVFLHACNCKTILLLFYFEWRQYESSTNHSETESIIPFASSNWDFLYSEEQGLDLNNIVYSCVVAGVTASLIATGVSILSVVKSAIL